VGRGARLLAEKYGDRNQHVALRDGGTQDQLQPAFGRVRTTQRTVFFTGSTPSILDNKVFGHAVRNSNLTGITQMSHYWSECVRIASPSGAHLENGVDVSDETKVGTCQDIQLEMRPVVKA
jgi:hypothetical protein